MQRRWQCSAWSALLVALGGCSGGAAMSGGTRGELGRVEFSYERSCFFGCPLEQPLLEGTREQIGLSAAGDAEGITVGSSDHGVASFAVERVCYCERTDSNARLDIRVDATCPSVWHKHCDNHVLVEAGASGTATLELRDANHGVIDTAHVLVRKAHDARFAATLPDKLGADVGTRFELEPSQSLGLTLTLYDDDGLKLLAPEGVDWHVDDVQVATISAFLTGRGADVHDGLSVNVQATGPGDTEVHVVVPGLDATVNVHVAE